MIYISGRYPVHFMLIFARNGHFSSFIHGTNHTPSHLLSIWGHPTLIICDLPTCTHQTQPCWSIHQNFELKKWEYILHPHEKLSVGFIELKTNYESHT